MSCIKIFVNAKRPVLHVLIKLLGLYRCPRRGQSPKICNVVKGKIFAFGGLKKSGL